VGVCGEDEVEVEGEVDGGFEAVFVFLLQQLTLLLAFLFEMLYFTEFG
jgi:hypothetical protein